MSEQGIKGTVFQHLRAFILERHGSGALERVCSALSPQARDILSLPVASTFYPLRLSMEAELKLIDLYYGGNLAAGREIGAYEMEQTLNSFLRFLVRFVDPKTVLKEHVRLWRNYYDCGRPSVEYTGENEALLIVEDFDPIHPVFFENMHGGVQAIIRACKVAVRLEHVENPLEGASRYALSVRWSERNGSREKAV